MRVFLLLAAGSVMVLAGCVHLPDGPPPSSPTTVIINGLESSGQRDYPCYKTSGGTDYIDFEGTITVKYPAKQGSTHYVDLDVPVAFSSPSTTQKFPVQVTVNVPNNGTPYKIEIYVKGKDCSMCASRMTAPNEPNAPCVPQPVTGGHQVAYPRWMQVTAYVGYRSQFVYNYLLPDFNVPNTCYTCTVPQ